MSRRLSPRARGLGIVAAALLIAALAAGRADLGVLAVPILVYLAIGLGGGGEPRVRARLEVDRDRVLERERATAELILHNAGDRGVEVIVDVGLGRRLEVRPAGPRLVGLPADGVARLALTLRPTRWGAHELGPVRLRASDRLGLVQWTGQIGARAWLRSFPAEQRLRELIAKPRTQPFLGAHVAVARGEGIEFAELRPFVTGDPARRIDWRATARRGSLLVGDRHPEHSSDVVLLIDTFAEARDAAGSTLDDAVRAAASLARAFLAGRDRVGLLDLAGAVQWLGPAFGDRQLYRILDALLSSEIVASYAARAADSIPRRVLPAAGLIVAVSPLLDERSTALLVDLHARGYETAVLEVSPLGRVAPARRPEEALARRLWRLRREAGRARLRALGIAVAEWPTGAPLAPALEEVNRSRRSGSRAVRR